MKFKVLPAAFIDSEKVSDDAIIVELSFSRQDTSKTKMLYVVTPLTEGDKTLECLNVLLFVILPYLMTVQSGRCSANATTMVILGIHLFSKFVPCRWWHCLSHVTIPTG